VRKYLVFAMAAASVSVLAAPVVASAAPTAKPHVLTVGKAGGSAVKVGAKLTASLAKGTTAIFSLGSMKLTCKSANFTAKVTSNPTRPGKALESLTAQTISKCTTNVAGIKIKSTKTSNLPYKVSVSDATTDPTLITGQSAKKPIELSATASFAGHSFTCPYTAKSVKGTASNKGNTLTVSKQKFLLIKGSNGLCPTSANFSAVFGPVRDASVKGSSKVFVN
jgi:hypothetical protein